MADDIADPAPAVIAWIGRARTPRRRGGGAMAIGLVMMLAAGDPSSAASPVSCGGAAMMGGAQLMCSQTDARAPPQLCTFSWDLMTTDNSSRIVEGSFLLLPGASNVQVYQASGF